MKKQLFGTASKAVSFVGLNVRCVCGEDVPSKNFDDHKEDCEVYKESQIDEMIDELDFHKWKSFPESK